MFYFARCGSAKTTSNATVAWADAACHAGTQQDTDCRLYNNSNVSTSKNLSGGWHDAGDYNKYVNFTWSTLTDLLLAYEENPTVWMDNYNIPESGNGIPDILDEIKYELDWRSIWFPAREKGGSVAVTNTTATFVGRRFSPVTFTPSRSRMFD